MWLFENDPRRKIVGIREAFSFNTNMFIEGASEIVWVETNFRG